MVTIINVLCKKEENFFVIINEAGKATKMYGSSFSAGSAIRAAGLQVDATQMMSLTDFKRIYGIV